AFLLPEGDPMSELAAKAEMLIHRPAQDVFDAFVQPDMLTKFWLSKASAALAPHETTHWEFMVKGASTDIRVECFDPPERLFFRFADDSKVELCFKERDDGSTHVTVKNFELRNAEAAVDSTEGFTLVLSDLKTLLETGKSANLVRDKAALIQERMGAGG
ncbi:MAG: SRPBCC domain-containing protein, partial [Caulobacterales bacterium]